jgi:hypothetical protein
MMSQEAVDARLDSVEVYVDGELEGYRLVVRDTGRQLLTPVRCCRTCAWADSTDVRYIPGFGLAYAPTRED